MAMVLLRLPPAVRLFLLLTLLPVAGVISCNPQSAPEQQPEVIRGLKAFRIAETSGFEVRRYPSVVRPSQESKLSFEISGQLGSIDLEIGQMVNKGDALAEIDPVSLQFQVQQSKAALSQSKANLDQARSDYQRRASLLEKGYVTRSEYDNAKNTLDSVLAQVEQAQQQLSIHKQNLSKSSLMAPFQGTLSNIYVKDFQQVSAGQEIVALYSEGTYEISFSVPAKVINSVKLGDVARVRFSDLSKNYYEGVISELGSRAEQVSAFPLVVTIVDVPEGLHAGMAADVELDIPLAYGIQGYLAPISSFDFSTMELGDKRYTSALIYVFDESTSTVVATKVVVAGVIENRVIISEGVSAGDIIARAGVSYLYDGMNVSLLPLEQ
jgi:RND family efflux transporter MFP subunit